MERRHSKTEGDSKKRIPTTPRHKKDTRQIIKEVTDKKHFPFPHYASSHHHEATASTKNAITTTTTTTNPFSIAAEVVRAKALRAAGSNNVTYSFIPANKKKNKPIKKPKKISNTK